MIKSTLLFAMILIPAAAQAIPSKSTPKSTTALFTRSELNNLAQLDETARPASYRKMQVEVAALQDEVGRMQLDRLIDDVLTKPARTRR